MKTTSTKITFTLLLLVLLISSCKFNENSKKDSPISENSTAKSLITPYGNLNPNLPPSKNFNLSSWKLSVPTDTDNNQKADNIKEVDLNKGYQNENRNNDSRLDSRQPACRRSGSEQTKRQRKSLRHSSPWSSLSTVLLLGRLEKGRHSVGNDLAAG